MKLRWLAALFFAGLTCALAQTAPPTSPVVSMGQIHLLVTDVDASLAFYKQLGGTSVKAGADQVIQFPGVAFVLEKGKPTAGSVGSTVNHIGFEVKAMQDWLHKWQAAGLDIEPIRRPTQVYLLSPDKVRIEFLEETTLSEPLRWHHIHIASQAIPEAQAWYVKNLGAVAGTRGQFQTANLQGVELTFMASQTAVEGTHNRALGRIGFEVRGMDELLRELGDAGITVSLPQAGVAKAWLTDPWGTEIELSEMPSTK